MSLGRQPPPKPIPALRKRRPMRPSYPRASARSTTSAPVASQTSAIALTKEILVARKAFAATFTSSAVAKSVTTSGTPASIIGAKKSRSCFSARPSSTPMTMRSGCWVSLTAKPSRRNSGFQASSASAPAGASSAIRAATRPAVPTGTVDLPTTSAGRSRWGARPEKAFSTWLTSAASPSGCWGVPTQTKCSSPNAATSAYESVKRSRPEATVRARSSSSCGSYMGASPRDSASRFSRSISMPSTSCPRSAMAAACVAPR